ncbi:MAG: hypothetical protein KatS3mg013_0690 [Actinomycetota bacterium]|jgi:hypothetical protein|nr:MAG: hypothetical protein KatS3mg013_0690 [Actinomycetota bacterium]
MRRRLPALVVATALVVGAPGLAWAAWQAIGTGTAFARADALPPGPTPTATVTGRNVHLSWSAVSFGDGTPVAGYLVERYDTSGTPQGIGASCSGTVTGLSCTETAVPPGTWRYGIRAVQGSWTGPEGTHSTAVTVGAPTFTWDSPAPISSLPATRTGTLTNFVTGEVVTFRLDDPSMGPILVGSTTPTSIPGSGSAAASVTIPPGVTDGAHTVYAVGSSGASVASAAITVDTTAPTVSGATIQKGSGGIGGWIRQGGTYRVYANASDATSGVASVTADVSTITTGASAVALAAGSWVVDGVTYGYRSALLTANATLSAGPKAFSVAATDGAGHSTTATGFTVTVDNTAPSGTNVQAVNGVGVAGRPDAGDVLTLTYGEPMEPESFIAGWTGASTTVTVRIVDNIGGRDWVQIWDASNTTQLTAFGTVRLSTNTYVTSTVSFTGSTATISGGTVTITLGTPSGTTNTVGAGTMRWTTNAGATDRAGNACTVANLNEPGPSDADF